MDNSTEMLTSLCWQKSLAETYPVPELLFRQILGLIYKSMGSSRNKRVSSSTVDYAQPGKDK